MGRRESPDRRHQHNHHAVRSLTNGGQYQYNLNGNMTSRIENNVTYTQTWDAENRLTIVTSTVSAAKPVSRFTYDGDGNRVMQVQISGTQVMTTAYAGAIEVQITATQRITKTYYSAGSQLIAMRQYTTPTSSVLYFLHSDHLGSVSVTTCGTGCGTAGTVLSRQKFDAWGNVRSGSGAMPTDVAFTRQRENLEIGLHYFKARYYVPYLNRWLSPDTIVPDPSNPQSLNRYSYTLNNPVKYTDPTGHDVDCGLGESGCKRPVKKKATPPPVITYIYNEMMTNVRGDVAQLIAKLNAQCFACMWSDTPLWWSGAAKGLSDAYMADAAAKADATAIFGWMVRTDGDWDHKTRIRNMEQAAGRDPDYQQVGDWAYRWDTWSNIHFGYIGAAAGFPINSLLDGAGTEQWWTDTLLGRATTEASGVSGERRFDEPWDQAAIQIGIDLWNTYGLAVKPEHVVYAVQNMPGLLKRPAQGGQP